MKEEDAEAIKQAQNTSMYRDPNMMAATLGMAQAEAMKTAAGNPNGAMMGFMGMNMAGGGMGGMNLQGLFTMGAAQQQMQQQQMQEQQMREQQMQQQQIKQQKMAQNTQTTETAAGWTCACGKVNTGKFCLECGKPKPADGWTCSCGTVNKGKFCMECGKPKPAGNHYIAVTSAAGNRKIQRIHQNSVRTVAIHLMKTIPSKKGFITN